MNYEILQGDALQLLKTLPANSVLLKKLAGDVFSTMYPFVTGTTKSDEVGEIETQGFVASPRLDVVGVESAPSFVGGVAALTPVIISLVDRPNNFFPVTRSVEALTFGRTAIGVVGICCARSARHAIGLAANPGLFYLRLFTENLARFFGVFLAEKCGNGIGLVHVVVAIRQVFTARARGYSIAYKPLPNLFRIAVDYLRYVVGTQLFNKILLPKPRLVNGLLGFLPFALASNRTKSCGLASAPGNFDTALFTI